MPKKKTKHIYFVYLHRRRSDHSVFYVGKGCRKRHSDTNGRNKYWHNVVNKHGFYAQIYEICPNEEYALLLEEALIEHYGIENLVNVYPNGGLGRPPDTPHNLTPEARQKAAERIKEFWNSDKPGARRMREYAYSSENLERLSKLHAERVNKYVLNREYVVTGTKKLFNLRLCTYVKDKEIKEKGYTYSLGNVIENYEDKYSNLPEYEKGMPVNKLVDNMSRKINPITNETTDLIFLNYDEAAKWCLRDKQPSKESIDAAAYCISKNTRKNKPYNKIKWYYVDLKDYIEYLFDRRNNANKHEESNT